MTKRNIELGIVSIFLISSIFILAGCSNKNQKGKQNQNQDQNQEQIQTNESKETNENDLKTKRGDGKMEGNPPAGMIEACKDKAEGDSCQISRPSKSNDGEEKTMVGICKKGQNSEVLSCHPNNVSQNEPGGNDEP
jgi:hypothetical protein